MISSALRIYLTANILVYASFAVMLFPEGLAFGIIAIFVSFLLSFPALLLLLFCFYLIHKYRPGITTSWIVLGVTAIICIVLPMIILQAEFRHTEDYIFSYLSAGAGLGGIVLQSVYLHKQFKSLHHENS